MKKKCGDYRDYGDTYFLSDRSCCHSKMNYFWCIIGINCGENVKNQCKGCEASGMKLKFVVNYINKMVAI